MPIQKKLEKKISEFKSLELAKSHLEKLETRISLSHHKLEQLHYILEKEYHDIEKLKKLSVRALFEEILGDKEAQLEKERQEYLVAALNYNETNKSLELLDFERDILREKVKHYNKTKSELHNLIRKREQGLIIQDSLARQLILDINKEIDNNIAIKRELQEAITVGLKTNELLKEICNDLDHVILWGEYTFNQADQHIRKMVYINRARDKAYNVKQLLQQFEDELADIYDDQNIEIESSLKIFRHFIQSFFDHLISDWVVLFKIKNASFTVQQIKDKVSKILQSLNHDLIQVDKSLVELKLKKKKIILALN